MAASIENDFRLAMRRLAATVTLITLTENDKPKGMAATAVCSLSMKPPSLLACINKSASLHAPLMAVDHFCVNVLHQDQIDVAKRFSDNSLRKLRFENADWRRHDLGPPILAGAQVNLICERSEVLAFGSHTILIGTAVDIESRSDIDPLLYLNGEFGSMNV